MSVYYYIVQVDPKINLYYMCYFVAGFPLRKSASSSLYGHIDYFQSSVISFLASLCIPIEVSTEAALALPTASNHVIIHFAIISILSSLD